MAAIRRPVRARSIRVLLIGMFAVPLVSLLVMWLIASLLTVPKALDAQFYKNNSGALNGPAVATISFEVPTERAQTYLWLLSGRKASKAALLKTRAVINAELPAAIAAFKANNHNLNAIASADETQLVAQLQRLPSIRKQADSGALTASAAFADYDTVVDAQYTAYDSSINQRGSVLVAESFGSVDAAYVLEQASREVALADGAFAFEKGQMGPAEHQLFVASAASRQQLLAQAMATLPTAIRNNYLAATSTANSKQFAVLEAQIANAADSKPLPVNGATWQKVSSAYLTALQTTEEANGGILQSLSNSASNGLLTQAILAAGVGLLAVAVSIALLLWFGRRVTGDLTKLHDSVREMAEERLPRVVARLRRGDDVDVAAETPAVLTSGIDEINRIDRSFGVVQGAAVEAAVDQARLRKGVNQVFLNISMRNQSLLHRQLSMLDSMERRTSDPGSLADLFRLDHLTTRMRRHAEGLIILSGSTPGRGWRDPVPVVDVLRAAVAEVEDYVRVDVTSESRDLIAGSAVNDVIHLVAELVENATVFSPPNTRIEVRADRAGTGVVAEIEDRGLGLSEEELADINRRLAAPPEFDLDNSEQLGLFVVSRLAIRHAIKVSLRQSVYGGTTAIMVLPFGVIVREEEAGALVVRGELADASQLPAGAPEPSAAAGADPAPAGQPPSFGSSGRHRLAATGRRADIGVGSSPVSDAQQQQPPPPQPLPLPPWEFAQDPRMPAGPTAGERPPWEVETATPWSDAFSRGAGNQVVGSQGNASQGNGGQNGFQVTGNQGTAGPGLSRPAGGSFAGPFGGGAPSVRPRPQPAGSGPGSSSHLGMPIRVPQASLAPQLRARREAGLPASNPAAEVDDRSPEATRNMLVTMQQGWERGRADDLDDTADDPDYGTER
ncbi:MAG TPA: sensor histidine kinase [Trebonia sp.]|nr:sensor histidine kinase [Trebonia sp.]